MKDRMGDFTTEEQAFKAVEHYKLQGVWPGVLGPLADGSFKLTYAPDNYVPRHDLKGLNAYDMD